MKNLYETILEKKFKSVDARNKWLRKQKVKVVGNTSSHNYEMGSVLSLDEKNLQTISIGTTIPSFTLTAIKRKSGGIGNSIYLKDLSLVGNITVASMKDEIAELKQQKKDIDFEIREIEDKIAFVQEKKIKNFDEETFKNWRILKEIKDNMENLDSYDFAEKLTKLING